MRFEIAMWLSRKGTDAWVKERYRLFGALVFVAHTLCPHVTSIKGPGADCYRWWDNWWRVFGGYPAFNHTRGDSWRTPCTKCILELGTWRRIKRWFIIDLLGK